MPADGKRKEKTGRGGPRANFWVGGPEKFKKTGEKTILAGEAFAKKKKKKETGRGLPGAQSPREKKSVMCETKKRVKGPNPEWAGPQRDRDRK